MVVSVSGGGGRAGGVAAVILVTLADVLPDDSLCSSDVYRRESGKCCNLPFFLTPFIKQEDCFHMYTMFYRWYIHRSKYILETVSFIHQN